MKLVLEGKVNQNYVQSLCMAFFRGEKFPQQEENPRGTVFVKINEKQNGIEATCVLDYNEKKTEVIEFVEFDEFSFERTVKTAVGRAVYFAGKTITKKDIPWGILTGIRPSKVGAELLVNHSYDVALKILVDKYLLSPDKAKLTLEVAKNETAVLQKYGDGTCSLYVSIPFCPTRCAYCSFISYATKKLFDLIPSYLEMLKNDIKSKAELINKLGLKLVTIYVGGGTPTTLNCEQLNDLLNVIDKSFNVSTLDEYTVECGRPDTVTKEKLQLLKKYGVKRISVNPQTLNDYVLKLIGRNHTVDDFLCAYDLAKKEEIGIVNTDLIAGLDGDNLESFKNTVDDIILLNPDNVTVHSFSVKKSARALENNKEIYNKECDYATESVEYAYVKLLQNGYVPYYMYRQKNTVSDLENVGYAKTDTFGIYNVLMMSDLHTVFSAGAGATTKLVKNTSKKTDIYRIFSPKYPYEYLENYQSHDKEILDFFQK